MKRKLAGLLLGMCAALFGCGSKTANPGVEVEEKEGQELLAGVFVYDFQDDFMELYRNELEKYLKEEYGANVRIMDGQNHGKTQKEQLEAFLEQEADLVILNPAEREETSVLVDMCAQKDVPVAVVNREPPEEELERWEKEEIAACYVGTDRSQAGICQGEIILGTKEHGDINRDGKISCVVIVGDEEEADGESRMAYVWNTLENAGFLTELLFEGRGDDEEKGELLTAQALEIYGDEAEVILCGNDAAAIGAEKAVRKAGLKIGEDVYLIGLDALREAVILVEEGRMTGTVLNDYKTQAHMAADAAIEMAKGKRKDVVIRADYIKIVGGE